MEKDWYPVGRSEQGASESSEAKPNSDKKKKRRRDESDSARARRLGAALETETKSKETAEHRRAQRALADIFVERGEIGEAKQSGRAKRKESEEPASLAGTEKKPKTEVYESVAAGQAAAERTDHAETENSRSAREQDALAGERYDTGQSKTGRNESDVPKLERDRLRPGELYVGEYVINLQDNKSPREREIPLHETPVVDTILAKAERAAEPEPDFRIAHKPQADEEVPPDEVEHDPAMELVAEDKPFNEPIAPPVYERQAEQPLAVRAFEVTPPGGFIPTVPVNGPEYPVGAVSEAGPAAVVPGAPEGFEAIPAAAAARRTDPADVYPMYAHQPTAGIASGDSGERMVTRQQADDEVYYATKAAQGRGVASGFLLAALWARHRGKKLRRRFNEQLGKQEKELKQTREDQRFYAAEQAQKQAETDRKLTAAEQRYTYAERQLANNSQPNSRFAAATLPEQHFASNGQRETAPLPPEVIAQMQRNKIEQQPGEPQQDVPEQLNVPPEHRLETSAWHTIEVDARTGRPVENPTFAYGHEYYQERKHESAPADHRNAAAGEVALVGAAATGGAQNGAASTGGGPAGNSGSALPPNVPNASMQGVPPSAPTAKAKDARKNLTKAASSGPIWPLVAALLLIFVVLIVLLH